jgi:hypothetical protein
VRWPPLRSRARRPQRFARLGGSAADASGSFLVHFALGNELDRQGHLTEALYHYDRAIGLQPQHHEASAAFMPSAASPCEPLRPCACVCSRL